MFSTDLISKNGYSFLSQGKVYLAKDHFSPEMLNELYIHNNTGSKNVYGLLIEKPVELVEMDGYSREFFNDCFGIKDEDFIPRCFNAEEYSELCQVIELFDFEESRWHYISSSSVSILYAIKDFQNLPGITNSHVSLVKEAVQAKMSYANRCYDNLNQHSLVKTIYGAVYKQLLVTSIREVKQKHFALLLRFIGDINIHLLIYKVKRL